MTIRIQLYTATLIAIVCGSLISCATLRYEDDLDVFIAPNHKAAPKSPDARVNVFQFVDNDRNAYLTRWAPKSAMATAFTAAKLDCLDAQSGTLLAKQLKPISQITNASIAPNNYKAIVKCIYDNGYNLVGRDSFYPDLFTLTFARKHISESEAYSPAGKQYFVKRNGVSFKELLGDAKRCQSQSVPDSAFSGGSTKAWEKNYARPFKETFINCLVAREYRVWQN